MSGARTLMRVWLGALAVALGSCAHGASPETAPQTLVLRTSTLPAGPSCAPVATGDATREVRLDRTFYDGFDQLDLKSGRWQPHFDGDYSWPVKRTLAGNNEDEFYVDPGYKGRGTRPVGLNPFQVDHGVLTITGDRIPPALQSQLYDFRYYSGLLTTRGSFAQKYGYFEIRADLPAGHGLWYGFWLLPAAKLWPPEIDVVEMYGNTPNIVANNTHWKKNGTGEQQASGCKTPILRVPGAFHTFGALWEPDRITYFVDRVAVGQIATPPGLDLPMYMLINLGLGGNAVGHVDQSTPLPAHYRVDHAAAWQIAGAPEQEGR